MKKPGLPLSTIALVAIMVGALYMVSKQVTPPPALPPVEPVTPASATMAAHGNETAAPIKEPTAEERKKEAEAQSAKMKAQYAQQAKERDEQQAAQHKAMEAAQNKAQLKGKDISRYDPTNTNIDSKYFSDMPMGNEGIQKTDEAVALVTAAKEKMRQETAAKGEKSKESGSKPTPIGAKQ